MASSPGMSARATSSDQWSPRDKLAAASILSGGIRRGSSFLKPPRNLGVGTKTVMPRRSARARSGRCGEPGLTLMAVALFHGSMSKSRAALPARQAERVRRDLRHHRFEALPDGSRADIDRHHPIRLEVEPRRLVRTGSAALDKTGDRDAVVAPVDLAALQCALFFPAELGQAALKSFAIITAVALGIDGRTARLQPRQPVRHLASADQVAPTHLGAVDPQVARRELDEPLAKERALVAAGRAIGARWGLIGEQRRRGHPHIWHAIWAGETLRQGARRDQPVGADIGPEIDEHLAAQSEDRAVAAAGDLDLAICLARMVHRGQMLAPVLEPADRTTDMPCGERDQEVLGIELAAGAKAAANIVLGQVDVARRQVQHRR